MHRPDLEAIHVDVQERMRILMRRPTSVTMSSNLKFRWSLKGQGRGDLGTRIHRGLDGRSFPSGESACQCAAVPALTNPKVFRSFSLVAFLVNIYPSGDGQWRAHMKQLLVMTYSAVLCMQIAVIKQYLLALPPHLRIISVPCDACLALASHVTSKITFQMYYASVAHQHSLSAA